MSFAWLRRLLTPLRYLLIKHDQKRKYDLYIPGVLAVLTTPPFIVFAKQVPLLGSQGLFAAVSGLVELLVAFFIAALAAIATFQKEDMDRPMSDPPPTLEDRHRGEAITRQLTRRQFLCYLFGYLAFITLFIAIFSIVARLFGVQISALVAEEWIMRVRVIGVLTFLFLFWNMIVTTLIGLYYLTDRIHWPDTRWQPPPEDNRQALGSNEDEVKVFRATKRKR